MATNNPDAKIYTEDKGKPPSNPDGGSAPPPPPPKKQKTPVKELVMKHGGSVKSSASRRADGIASRGKTKGRFV